MRDEVEIGIETASVAVAAAVVVPLLVTLTQMDLQPRITRDE